jgi:MFS transporter, SP family, galactose:H+ symporter
MIYVIAAIAAIAGFLFGFDEGVIAGALHLLRAQFTISPAAEGFMTAAVPLGAMVGAIAAGPLAEPYGRRVLLLIAAAMFVIGALLAAVATAIWMLTLARLILGVAIGVAGMMAPLYISESAPAERRGLLVSLYQLAITLGILGAYLVDYVLDEWRWMFAAGIIPGVALGVGIYFLSDTPRWLVSRKRTAEAKAAVARIRELPESDPAVSREIADISSAVEAGHGRWSDLFTAAVRPALIVAMGLFFLQQLSGINAVIYYAPTVFGVAGFSSTATQVLATVGLGIVNVAATLVGMALIDRIGRRRLLLLGFAGTTISLGMIALGAATDVAWLDVVAMVGLVLYIASFAVSLGPLPWVMMSELFPLKVRGLGMSLASVTNWGFNFLVVFSFPILLQVLGLGGIFAIYAFVCALGILFTLRLVPETAGLTLEDIEEHLHSGRPLTELGRAKPPLRAAVA